MQRNAGNGAGRSTARRAGIGQGSVNGREGARSHVPVARGAVRPVAAAAALLIGFPTFLLLASPATGASYTLAVELDRVDCIIFPDGFFIDDGETHYRDGEWYFRVRFVHAAGTTTVTSGVFSMPDGYGTCPTITVPGDRRLLSQTVSIVNPTDEVAVYVSLYDDEGGPNPSTDDDIFDIDPFTAGGGCDDCGENPPPAAAELRFYYRIWGGGIAPDHTWTTEGGTPQTHSEGAFVWFTGDSTNRAGVRLTLFDNGPFSTDTTPPASKVNALSATQTTTSFTVGWTGTDATSGIAYYRIYNSRDGGPVVLWRADVASTSASFTGVEGSRYCFYSRAMDNAGNWEAAPASYDACTQVAHRGPITSSVSPASVSVVAGSAQVFTATVRDVGNHDVSTVASVTWTVTGDATCGSLSTTTGVSTTFTADPGGVGKSCTVNAAATLTADVSWSNAGSAAVRVTASGIQVTITPASETVVEGGVRQFTATVMAGATDVTSSSTVDWTVNPSSCGSVSPTRARIATFTADSAAGATQCTVDAQATYNPGSEDLYDTESAAVSVTHAAPVAVQVSPPTGSVEEGNLTDFDVTIRDFYGHLVTDQSTVGWSVAPASCGAFEPADSASTTFTAATSAGASSCTVTATAGFGTSSAFANADLDVLHAGPLLVALDPSSATLVEGGSLSMVATVTDARGHSLTFSSAIAWSVSPAGCGTVSPVSGSSTTLTAGSTAGGTTCTVRADATLATLSASETAIVVVDVSELAPPPGLSTWIVALVLVIVAVLIAVLVLMRRRRKAVGTQEAAGPPPSAPEVSLQEGGRWTRPPEAPTITGPSVAEPTVVRPSEPDTTGSPLAMLDRMKAEGLLTEQEYQEKRKEFLGKR